jgi:hypothetical protein
VNTSIETQIEDWLSTSDHGGRGRARIAGDERKRARVTRPRLTAAARLDLAGLVAAGMASSAFFLAALLPASPPTQVAPPQLTAAPPAVASQPSAPTASAAHITPTSVDVPRQSTGTRARRSTARPATAKRETQSRWARLLVGDGRAMPYHVPRLPSGGDPRPKP